MSTVMVVTEIPDEELREHLAEILGRVEAGEELTITVAGRPVAELHPVRDPRPRFLPTAQVLGWAKADPRLLDDIRDLTDHETTDDLPWPS